MVTNSVPTLSPDGWLHSTSARCDALFADFLAAANSQYPQAKIDASCTWLLARYQDDLTALREAMARTLTGYFERYFPSVQCTVTSKPNPQDAGREDLTITLTVTDEQGQTFTLGKIATVGEGRVLAIAKENNGTLPTQA